MRLTVQRFDPDHDVNAHDQSWEVPEVEGMTILDALNWVRENQDPTLAFRFACRTANSCKTCTASINGKSTYTCTYPSRGEVAVAPLPGKVVLRDLAVESTLLSQ